jgi:hypothetical protein
MTICCCESCVDERFNYLLNEINNAIENSINTNEAIKNTIDKFNLEMNVKRLHLFYPSCLFCHHLNET